MRRPDWMIAIIVACVDGKCEGGKSMIRVAECVLTVAWGMDVVLCIGWLMAMREWGKDLAWG